jgi:hypothetical protein
MAADLASVTVPGNEDSTTEAKLETSEQALSVDDSWSVRNGSLPVAVPTSSNQVGAGLHHVESSTTDSGVSNASSVTSDSVPPLMTTEEGLLTTAELRLGLREVEQALGDLNKGVRSTPMSCCKEREGGDGFGEHFSVSEWGK